MMRDTGMEYTDGQVGMYITENGNRKRKMAKDTRGGQMDKNIGESTRKTSNGERESNKRTEFYTETNTKTTSAPAEVKYSELLYSLSRNK
jgi:hypothetical protein